MTFRILRSRVVGLSFDYAKTVEEFRQQKMAHRFTGGAAPHAPDIVEQAVLRVQYPIEDQKPDDFVADYEIVDDLPPPPSAAERKAVLLGQLRQAEAAALTAVISPGRERMLQLDISSIRFGSDGKLTAEQQALVDRQTANNARKMAVHRHFVDLEIELEDLSDNAIAAWTFKPFTGG